MNAREHELGRYGSGRHDRGVICGPTRNENNLGKDRDFADPHMDMQMRWWKSG